MDQYVFQTLEQYSTVFITHTGIPNRLDLIIHSILQLRNPFLRFNIRPRYEYMNSAILLLSPCKLTLHFLLLSSRTIYLAEYMRGSHHRIYTGAYNPSFLFLSNQKSGALSFRFRDVEFLYLLFYEHRSSPSYLNNKVHNYVYLSILLLLCLVSRVLNLLF